MPWMWSFGTFSFNGWHFFRPKLGNLGIFGDFVAFYLYYWKVQNGQLAFFLGPNLFFRSQRTWHLCSSSSSPPLWPHIYSSRVSYPPTAVCENVEIREGEKVDDTISPLLFSVVQTTHVFPANWSTNLSSGKSAFYFPNLKHFLRQMCAIFEISFAFCLVFSNLKFLFGN